MTVPAQPITIDAAPTPMWTALPDGTFDSANRAWQAYTGMHEDVNGTIWEIAVHPVDAPSFEGHFREATETGRECQAEYRFRRGDGVYRWHLCHIAPVPDQGGNVTRWMGVTIDNDDRWQVEAALRASEASFQNSVATAGDIVFTIDLAGTILSLNPAIRQVLGYDPEELLGRSMEEVLVPPDQIEIARDSIRRKLSNDEPGALEIECVAKDGHRVTLEVMSRVATAQDHGPVIQGVARDVTARKRMHEALTRLAAIVEDSDDAILSRSLDGIVTSWNRGAERLYGYTADEILGQPVSLLVPHVRGAEVHDLTRRVASGERVPHFETVRLRKDGTLVDVSISLSPLTDSDGRLIGISTIARDVTAVKQAMFRLHTIAEAGTVLGSEMSVDAQLRALAYLTVPHLADWCVIDLAADGPELRRVAVAHVDPKKLAMAEDLQRRYPPDPTAPRGPYHVMRTGQSELMSEIPEELLVAAARDPEHLQLIKTVGLRSYLTVPLQARGRMLGTLTFVTAESGRCYGPQDLAVGEALADLAALAIDNAMLYRTAQEAEERYRTLFAGVADAILVADADRRYIDANPAACELLGYSQEALLALRVDDVVVGESAWTTEQFERYVSEGRWQGELEIRRSDGKTLPVEALATVVDLPSGPVYLSALRDISERHRLDRLQRDFLAMVTHDLRTPLTSIRGQAQLLKRRAEYREAQVVGLLTASARMQQLIDDLADVVTMESGPLLLRRTPSDLCELVNEVAAELHSAMDGRRVTVVASACPVFGSWDAARLKQVLMNILENAFKYTGSEIDVMLRIEDGSEQARVHVTDKGPGIAPEQVPRLFDRFYRADVTGAGGLGLGLYISRMLVEAHGGCITVKSKVGYGSTFTVALPKHA